MAASSAAGFDEPALQQGTFSLQPVNAVAAVEEQTANGNGGPESRLLQNATPDDSREAGPLRSLHVENAQQRWEDHSEGSPGSSGADAKVGRWAECASGCPGAATVLGAFSELDSRLSVVCAYAAVLAVSQSSLRATLPSYVEVGTPGPPRAAWPGWMMIASMSKKCHADRRVFSSSPTTSQCHRLDTETELGPV